ncbi:hypothetical protein BGZ49_001521, partial [Haplosporangium sp. Z 27]
MSEFPTNQEGFFIGFGDTPFVIAPLTDAFRSSIVLKTKGTPESQRWIYNDHTIVNMKTKLALTAVPGEDDMHFDIIQEELTKSLYQRFLMRDGKIFVMTQFDLILGVESEPGDGSIIEFMSSACFREDE